MAGFEDLLGVGAGMESPALVDAARRWPTWAACAPVLGLVEGPAGIEAWTWERRRGGDLDAVDTALLALGRRAGDGGAEAEAAIAVLAWLFRRAAHGLIASLAHLAPGELDHIVAVNFWLLCRAMPPWRHRVAANFLGTLRTRALIDARHSDRRDRTWDVTEVVDPVLLRASGHPATASDPAELVAELLADALENRILSEPELRLVLEVLRAASQTDPTRAGRWGGLASREATTAVAAHHGVSSVTVRRRLTRILETLAEAYQPRPFQKSA